MVGSLSQETVQPMQAWETDVKTNMMINHGKREITIPDNFILRKDILKYVRESNDQTDFILSHIRSDLGVKKN